MSEARIFSEYDRATENEQTGKKNCPIVVLGWLSYDIIKACLTSINLLEGINPQIYFVENKSKNSDKIKEMVLSTNNIKGYIQYKENFAANAWKTSLEHFLPRIKEEFVTITDGDFIFDVDAMTTQYELFKKDSEVGITSQRRSFVGLHGVGHKAINVKIAYDMWINQYNPTIISPFLRRGIFNSILLTTARKSDWQHFIDRINHRDILMSTHALDNRAEEQYRSPLFADADIYRYFEIVLGKKSLIYSGMPAYHLTDEHSKDPASEYSIEKEKFGYERSWGDYGNNSEFYHNKFYPDGNLKFDEIV
jgi:hypothetical protein